MKANDSVGTRRELENSMEDTMTVEEEKPAVVAQPIVPLRPYYDRDGITIYNADCRKVLPFLEPFDLLLTDPPYGIGESTGKNRNSSNMATTRDYGSSDWDLAPPRNHMLEAMIDQCRTAIIFGGNYFALPPSRCWLVWDKDNTGMRADAELAWTNRDAAVRLFQWRWNGMLQEHSGDKKEPRVHPTQKPLALMKWCLGLVPDAKSVLDPFMGSGTTLVAAKQLGLRAVGIEINADYCAKAVERLRQNVLAFGEY